MISIYVLTIRYFERYWINLPIKAEWRIYDWTNMADINSDMGVAPCQNQAIISAAQINWNARIYEWPFQLLSL